MDLAQLVLVFLSCVMFIALVTTLVRAGRGSSRGEARLVSDPSGEGWLSVEEVAELLETDPEDVLGLVDRGSIPFFVDAGSGRSVAAVYWFRRDEIDDWVIG
jgi:hypothetical protein